MPVQSLVHAQPSYIYPSYPCPSIISTDQVLNVLKPKMIILLLLLNESNLNLM